jgi:glycerophosphoryl diester phosphodiesterase
VKDQTLEELRKLDAGSWKDPKFAGEKIPTLAEAIATIPDGKRMFIEIKCGPEVLEPMKRVLAESGKKPVQLTIIGFNLETMRQAKALFPEHQVYWLASPKEDKKTGTLTSVPVAELVAKAKDARMDGLNLSSKFPIDAAYVKTVHEAGLKFFVWTVDDAAVAKSLLAAGVDGITTNRPAWLREQLGLKTAAR